MNRRNTSLEPKSPMASSSEAGSSAANFVSTLSSPLPADTSISTCLTCASFLSGIVRVCGIACFLLTISNGRFLAAPCGTRIGKQVACHCEKLKRIFETLTTLVDHAKDVMNLRLVGSQEPACDVGRDGGTVGGWVIGYLRCDVVLGPRPWTVPSCG